MNENMVGRYELIAPLGHGAMGEVYRAHDPELNRAVAVKIIARPVIDQTDESYQRFRREVQAAARLNHAHIVTIFDVNLENRPPYVVMELLTGGTLTAFLNNNRLDWMAAFRLLRPICRALAHAHEAGIIHRDVKPDNILFAHLPGERPKLADFGLAFRQDDERLTQDGGILGTAAYLPPEQAHGIPVDARADIYSLGIILFEAIAGYNPLRGKTISQTLINSASLEPIDTSPLQDTVPAQVIALLEKSMAKERRQRYASCRQLEEEMVALLGEVAPTSERVERLPTRPELFVDNPYAISLPEGADEILSQLFTRHKHVEIEEELKGGFSGSRVFVVKPVRLDSTPELPTVVKMGPIQAIEREWQAYQEHIQNKLPGIADIHGTPAFPQNMSWGGIHYALIGRGTFYFESFAHYYRRATAADLSYLLTQRLFRQFGQLWRFNTPQTGFNWAASYDHLLPANLVIRPGAGLGNGPLIKLQAGIPPTVSPAPGAAVRLTGFVITEVDVDEQVITLDWPADNGVTGSYRVKLQPFGNPEQVQVGLVLESIEGVVTTTRRTALQATLLELMGIDFDKSAAAMTLLGNRPFPNPVARLPKILAGKTTVRLASIHGDLNPENILVDPEARDVQIIDFGSARHDHVLHDLLRLETGIVTRLLPATFREARLPADAVVNLFSAVHGAVFAPSPPPSPGLVHPGLEKPFTALLAIRQEAKNYLFNANDPAEYYQGLTLYLLGSLKYRNLDLAAKKIAFYTAAVTQSLIDDPAPQAPVSRPPPSRTSRRGVPVNDQHLGNGGKDPYIEPVSSPPRPDRMAEVRAWLTEHWLPAGLLTLLVVVLVLLVFRSLSENETAGSATSTMVPTGVPIAEQSTWEPSPASSPTPIQPTATIPPPTPTTAPATRTISSPLALFSQNADYFTLPLQKRTDEAAVALLLDTSASMRDEDKLIQTLAAAIGFLYRLDEDDEVFVYTYSDAANLLEPSGAIATAREPLQQILNTLFAHGEPMLYDVLCQAAETMTSSLEDDPGRQAVIVLLTDGKDSGRGDILTAEEALTCLSDLDERVVVHAIALGSDADRVFLQDLANLTNGPFYDITANDILDHFAQFTFE